MISVINARILMMSRFFKVFSIIDLNVFGVKIIGNPNATIKKAVRSNKSSGNVNMRERIRK